MKSQCEKWEKYKCYLRDIANDTPILQRNSLIHLMQLLLGSLNFWNHKLSVENRVHHLTVLSGYKWVINETERSKEAPEG